MYLWLPVIVLVFILTLGFFFRGMILRALYIDPKKIEQQQFRTPVEIIRTPSVVLIFAAGFYLFLSLVKLPGLELEHFAAHMQRILIIIIAVVIIWSGSELASVMLSKALIKSSPEIASLTFISHGVRIILIVLGGMALLDRLGISVAPILAALGVGGLGMALGLQATLADAASGLQLVLGKQFQAGDKVKLSDGEEGVIKDIGWRNTVVLNGRNNHVVIPNRKFSEQMVTNFSRPDANCELIIPIVVNFAGDPLKIMAILEKEMRECSSLDGVLPDPVPRIRLTRLDKAEGIEFYILFRVRSIELEGALKHEINTRLWKVLWEAKLLPAEPSL